MPRWIMKPTRQTKPMLAVCMAVVLMLSCPLSPVSLWSVRAEDVTAFAVNSNNLTVTDVTTSEVDLSGEDAYIFREVTSEEETALLLWSACKVYGMPKQNIAAILGCLSVISSLDPGSVELVNSIYDANDPLRLRAKEDPSLFAEEYVLSYYQATDDVHIYLCEDYLADDGSYYAGMGLAMWRGNRGQDFLKQADFLVDGRWDSIDFNAAYLLQSAAPTGSDAFGEMLCQWKSDTYTLEEAVTMFATQWLGYVLNSETPSSNLPTMCLSTMDLEAMIEKAEAYLDAIAEWTSNGSYDESFALDIKTLVTRLDHHRVIDTFYYDNSTPELAAVSLSYRNQGDGFYNNGLELYRTVRDNVDDPYVIYQSCDRLIATALRWSGADVDYPHGAVKAQYSYMVNSDQWELIAVGENISRDNLEPGDIFLCLGNVGHIWMYVGQDAIRAIYGDDFWPSDADSVSAGYQHWSPMVGNYYHMHIEENYAYEQDIDSSTGTYYNPPRYVAFYQFRMVYSDESDLYADAADRDPVKWPR